MNYKLKLLLPLFAAVFFAVLFSSSCKKERGMEVIITVRMLSDTNIVVPNARIELFKNDLKVVGYSNSYGEFSHTFDWPAQVDIAVAKDTLKGIGVLNIGTPGETIRKTIFVF